MNSTFEDLSQTISPEEKKNLLGKIQVSLNLSAKDIDGIVSKTDGPEELKNKLIKEVEKLGVIDRFLLRVSAFFLSRSEYEIMAGRRLASSRAILHDRIPELIDFSHQEWSPEFGKLIYDLFAEANGLKPVFEHLFHQKLTLEAGLILLLREEHPASVRRLDDLFPDREMASIYRTEQKKAALQAALDEKLGLYFEGIPQLVFEKIKDRLRPLYFLRPLVLFPYGFLLEQFGHDVEKAEVTKYPYLIGAPWLKSGGLLERLYYGLYLAAKLDWKEGTLNQIFQGVAEHLTDEKHVWTVEILNQKITALVRTAQDIAQRVPWKEVLQWSFQDPYYSVKYILPKFSVKDFYQTSILLSLGEELAIKIPQMRRQILTEERTLLFENGTLRTLEFYVAGSGSAPGSPTKVQGFQHTEALNLLWSFLNHQFPKKIQVFHQSLSRLVSPSSKSSLQGLNNAIEELSSLKNQIFQFDRSLHPDGTEGKEFQKLRYESSSKALGLKPFIQLIQNKDDQAMELINTGQAALQSLLSQFSGIRERNVPALKAILGLPYLLEGQQETIEDGLDRILMVLQRIQFVLKEATNLES